MIGSRRLGIVLLVAAGALDPGSTALSQATKVPGLVHLVAATAEYQFV